MPILMWLVICPFLASLLLLFAPYFLTTHGVKRLAIILSLIPLGLLIANHMQWIGAEVRYLWFSPLAIDFSLKIDGISLLFLYLTALVIPISILAIDRHRTAVVHFFYSLVLLLQGLLTIFFTAKDLAVFIIFWESITLPLYFIIVFWGGAKRQIAGLKFLIYMIAGSSLLVFSALALYYLSAMNGQSATFDLNRLALIGQQTAFPFWLGIIFLLAFAVKAPLFPFHAWLPDAYTQAPIAGTILLSALLSKAGIYGMIRIGFEIFPDLINQLSPYLLTLSICGVFYGALAAWKQADFKRLIAYSSFSHVNFILVGLFIWNSQAHTGAILQAFNHGITITGLFLVVGWLESRIGTTQIDATGGLAVTFPKLCWLTLAFALSSVAMPGTNNFIGELLIFFGLFSLDPFLASILGIIVILSVVYMLNFMQQIYFGPLQPANLAKNFIGIDIGYKQLLIALPLILIIFWIGLYPMPLLNQLQQLSEHTLQELP